jgi:tetratricopeptide (TPR) repeat protein
VNSTGEIYMTVQCNSWLRAGVLAGTMLAAAGWATAQNPPAGNTQNPPPAADKKDAPVNNTISLDNPAAPPLNAEEEAAYKTIADSPASDQAKQIELGEGFLQKYPESRYRANIYSMLTMDYLRAGQVQKMEAVADKELALNPNDVQIMAIVGQALPRAMNSSTPDQAKVLAKAELYSRKAIELTPTYPKPANISEESFSAVKNQTLAMAHGGLGLVYVRRNQFKEAIPELNQSVTLDPTPDPVNFFLLGLANTKASHFDDAIAAYNKCAVETSPMQDTCKKAGEEAKKLAATQLSAPK